MNQENQKQRPFKLKEDARINLNAQEISFIISLGQIFAPFTQVVAFAEYLKEKVVNTEQITFIEDENFKPLNEVNLQPELVQDLKLEETEEDKKASEELSKMRVVHNAKNVQEELANQ
jgi:hypothetical protein